MAGEYRDDVDEVLGDAPPDEGVVRLMYMFEGYRMELWETGCGCPYRPRTPRETAWRMGQALAIKDRERADSEASDVGRSDVG